MNPAGEWEESQTLDGRVLFSFCVLCCIRLQIPSYRIFHYKQEKSVLFFAARCKSYCFHVEILICGDCAVASPFKMLSNKMAKRMPAFTNLKVWIKGPFVSSL